MVIVDASGHPEVREVIRLHEFAGTGDCASQWASPALGSAYVHLILTFERPVVTKFVLQFALPEYGGAVDGILTAKSMYLVDGAGGVTFSQAEGRPRILMEVGAEGFYPHWEKLFRKSAERSFRELGSTRKQARLRGAEFVASWRAAMNEIEL
ncbi:hypothetical protein [Serinibacter arcticus]|uniref:hypothetical protein n=1 Tax=Serinibacter arcticus TaxID=1655435 RepID=UPI001091FE9B|nr:hypothetical protein [Serinibacter arcticus]